MIAIPKHTHAFTLIELIVVLVIFSILLLCSVGNFSSVLTRQRTQSDLTQFFHTLQYARTEAIKCNCTVTVCPTMDGKQCSGIWEQRYIVLRKNKVIMHNAVHAQTGIDGVELKKIAFQGDGRCLQRGTLTFTDDNAKAQVVLVDSTRARILVTT